MRSLVFRVSPFEPFPCPSVFLRCLEWAVAQATRSGEGRQEGRESGYYHLHRNLNYALLHKLASSRLIAITVARHFTATTGVATRVASGASA